MRRALLGVLAVLACGRAEIYGPHGGDKNPDGGSGGSKAGGGSGFAGGFGDGGGRAGGSGGGTASFDGGTNCPPVTGAPCAFTSPPSSFSCISGLRVISHDTTMGRDRWVLGFQQPVDHDAPSGPKFEQQLWLFHKDYTRPMVLLATGYDIYDTIHELSLRFDVNELSVEHRFFGTSYPDGGQRDYRTLDIRQMSMDLHRIRLAFASLYSKPWVSTGASKGGMTMVYYRRYFPCDVAGTVAYVAPLLGVEVDPRFPAFLSSVGGAARLDCRNRLANLQTQLLQRRAFVEPQIRGDGGYSIMGSPEIAYELGVRGLSFTFWQYLEPDGCTDIPSGPITDSELVMWASAFVGAADSDLEPYSASYYQAATQLGYIELPASPFAALLQFPDAGRGARNFVSKSITVPPFDPAPIRDVQGWLADGGQGVVFIYGEFDPWSASQYALGNSIDTFKGIAPGANHLTLMFDLDAADEENAMQRIERWLGIRRTNLQMLQAMREDVEPPNLKVPPTLRPAPRLRASRPPSSIGHPTGLPPPWR